VREIEISLCKWSGGTAQFRTLEAGAGPASNVRVGYSAVSTQVWAPPQKAYKGPLNG